VKLLLDTHIWLWAHREPKRISKQIIRAMESPKNEVWISPVSIWEIILLCDKGRLRLQPNASAWIVSALAAGPLREAPLTSDVVLATGAVALPHNDPADRFLAATAKVYDLTLITSDENLLGGSGFRTLANR
jgi:PIN domain nuclease of toxin-antitoxin system